MILKDAGLVLEVGRVTPLGERPVSWTLRHGRGLYVTWTLVSLFWLTMSLLLAWDMVTHGETWGLLMPAVFVLIGCSLFLFSVRDIAWRRTETIGRDAVEVLERNTSTRSAWSEPLSRYRGVAIADVTRDKDSMLGGMKVVVLDHEKADRRIVLWSHMLSREVERRREDYARWLDLPAVAALPAAEKGEARGITTVRRA